MNAIRFDDLPATVGQVYEGQPFQLDAEGNALFSKATWLDRAYPDGDVPEFPSTLVEGFWLLAMVDAVYRLATGTDDSSMWGLNYGLDKVRFVSPVHLGDTILSTFEIVAVVAKDQGYKVLRHCEFRVDGSTTPAMVADWWAYALPRGTLERARREGR